MTTKELEQELSSVKQTLQQLQRAVERMSATLDAQTGVKPIQWLTLIGVGKEIWNKIDADTYVDAERNSWN